MFARTERLLLRPGWAQDAPALYAAVADEAIVRNLASAPWPYTLGDAEAFLETERLPAEPSMLIFRRTLGAPQLAGAIGFGRRPDGEMELGYWIARPFWGLGYATEAGRAVIAMARESLRLPRVHAGHFLDNPASGRVLHKLGFRPAGVAPRYSAGRRGLAPCRDYALELGAEEDVSADARMAA
ncbi:GNAT family N-acetyltransferase [Sphingosinicella sp. BN140058]|uniref:GNAT family N-acetyltransferase n=1 Tax=Sphingosinicella sp. BN140058 TaxID=1892855 RepID=UPI0010103966|nr:GNAT family N-acetyltransferase [Sphingosinicella sp. BN140058]QAY78015.1 N-acetyltransferase [Sphingosinicella sp. BN140058]